MLRDFVVFLAGAEFFHTLGQGGWYGENPGANHVPDN